MILRMKAAWITRVSLLEKYYGTVDATGDKTKL